MGESKELHTDQFGGHSLQHTVQKPEDAATEFDAAAVTAGGNGAKAEECRMLRMQPHISIYKYIGIAHSCRVTSCSEASRN